MRTYFCKYMIKELQQENIKRPFRTCPITEPEIARGRMVQASEKDQQILAKVELLAGSMACSDLSSKPKVPKSMDKYTEEMMSLNAKFDITLWTWN